MKRRLLILLLCLLAGWLGSRLWLDKQDGEMAKRSDEPSSQAHVPEPMPAAPSAPAEPQKATTTPMATTTNSTPPPPGDDKTGARYKRAYMLSIDKGALSLVEAQDIEGDFAPRRGKQEEWSNMLRFRLMSDSNTVLAEELLPAPDQACHVLDPRSSDGKPVDFTTPGPIIFQVRLPRVKDARRLDIFRILQPGEPATENRLASLPLPQS